MLEGLQTGVLLVVAGEWDAKYGIHIGRESTPSYMKCKLLAEQVPQHRPRAVQVGPHGA